MACQTAIMKRRHRRASAGAGLARYGSWAQHSELEAALRQEEGEGKSDGAESDDGDSSDGASEVPSAAAAPSRRKTIVLAAASNSIQRGTDRTSGRAVSQAALHRPQRKSMAATKVMATLPSTSIIFVNPSQSTLKNLLRIICGVHTQRCTVLGGPVSQ